MTVDPRPERRYQLAPLDTSGVFLGLNVVQACLVGAGILSTVACLTLGAPVPLAAIPGAAAAVLALGRVRGRPVVDWIPAMLFWQHTRLLRRHRWYQPLPLLPVDPDIDARSVPRMLAGIYVRAVAWRNGRWLGAVEDRQHETLTAVIPVTGNGFPTESVLDQERSLAGWGDLLAQFASDAGVVTHLGWSDLARPSGLTQHRAWLNTISGSGHPRARASYDELLTSATGGATIHDTVVTITVARHRLPRRHRSTDAALERALTGTVDSLLRALHTAGLTAGTPYTQRELHRVLRTRIEPLRPTTTSPEGTLTDRVAQTIGATAMPVAVEAEWSSLRTDDTYHRTWWIGTWPRLPLPAAWMEPFLAAGGITRAITVSLAPVPAHQSRRRIERDLVKLESDAITKQDKGRRVDARHHRATRALLEREEELVAGYAEVAYLGLITVTAPDPDTLEDHSEIIEQLAREHGMDLRVLHGRQDLAWAAALPLGLAPAHTLAS